MKRNLLVLALLFAQLDLNRDGRLVWDEASAHPCVERYFWAADRDQSGHVDREEFGVIAANCL